MFAVLRCFYCISVMPDGFVQFVMGLYDLSWVLKMMDACEFYWILLIYDGPVLFLMDCIAALWILLLSAGFS